MPLTEKGFQRLTYDDILNMQIDRAKLLFGEDIDTTDKSVFGKFLRLYCLDAAQNQELAEGVYLSAFPNTASGVGLDRLCPLVGISRNPATYARHNITIIGTAGETVEAGFLVAAGEIIFHTTQDYAIGDDGTVSVIVECNESGTVGNVEIGKIKDIVNPNANVKSILHTDIETIADDFETDYSLRTRFSQAFSTVGSSTLEAIRGAILRVTGVESVLILENDTNIVNEAGVPAHSFRCYVLAPESLKQEIGEAIFSKKPIGVGTDGTETVTTTDIGGGTHTIKFSWTETVGIHVRCTLVTDSNFSDEKLQEIKDNIVEKLSRYGNGQDVTASSLYADVYVDGVTDVTVLEISPDGSSYGASVIEINDHQVARTTDAYIEVTVQ